MKEIIREFVFASTNINKYSELKSMLKSYRVKALFAKDFNLNEIKETGKTFFDNALLKAKYVSECTKLPSLADDSGLCINSLPDILGINSARFAIENNGYEEAIKKIEHLLINKEDKSAKFVCSLVLYMPNGEYKNFKGEIEGKINFPPKGKKGFAYDPIFIPKGYSSTFAELGDEIKNQISHRYKAFESFATECLDII